jgi:hypothetical protein
MTRLICTARSIQTPNGRVSETNPVRGAAMKTKRCVKCGERKAMDHFTKCAKNPDRRQHWCRACHQRKAQDGRGQLGGGPVTRQQVMDGIREVMEALGFVGADAQKPATTDDVAWLTAQLFQHLDDVVADLEAEEDQATKAPDGHGHGV